MRDAPRDMVLAGVLVAWVLTLELVLATITLRPVLGLGWYPAILWLAACAAGVGVYLACRATATWLPLPGTGRLARLLRSPATTLALAAGALVLLHLHQLRVPNTVAAVDRTIFWAVPAATISLLALVQVAARHSRNAATLLSVCLSLACLLVSSAVSHRAPSTATYVGPWPLQQPAIQEALPVLDPAAPAPVRRQPPRLLVVGLDGADWRYIDALMERGRMPNLQKLVAAGVRGIMENPDLRERVSPVAWTSILTGTPPSTNRVRTWGSRPTALPRIWEMTASGGAALAMNVPGTFPVRSGNGVATAGLAAPGVVEGTDPGVLVGRRAIVESASGPLTGRSGVDPSCPDGRRFEVPSDRFSLWNAQFHNTSPSILLAILGTRLRDATARSLSRVVEPAAFFCASVDSAGTLVVVSRDDGRLRVEPAEWSPWLTFDTPRGLALTRLKNLSRGGDAPTVFVGPLTQLMLDGLASPAEALSQEASEMPWLSPGADSIDFVDGPEPQALIDISVEWALAVEQGRVGTALRLLESRQWSEVVYILGSTDRLHHVLVPTILQRGRDVPVIDELATVYETADGWLGEIMAHAGSETVVAVISDHGSRVGMGYHLNHAPEGIYLLRAPGLRGAAAGPAIAQEDLLPILLAHLGLPTATDLPGRLPRELWPLDADGQPLELPEPIDSWAELLGMASGEAGDGTIDPRVREQLRALGYIQ